jgi:hypothetical protein
VENRGRKHGFQYIVKYMSDNHGKTIRRCQERRTREQKKMIVKYNKQRKGMREEYETGGKEVGKYR